MCELFWFFSAITYPEMGSDLISNDIGWEVWKYVKAVYHHEKSN